MDLYKRNEEKIDELIHEIWEKIGYVDAPTIAEILVMGIMHDQEIAIGYIGKPNDALNYLKESNHLVEHLIKKIKK